MGKQGLHPTLVKEAHSHSARGHVRGSLEASERGLPYHSALAGGLGCLLTAWSGWKSRFTTGNHLMWMEVGPALVGLFLWCLAELGQLLPNLVVVLVSCPFPGRLTRKADFRAPSGTWGFLAPSAPCLGYK